ncbi:hypothetical protein GCM10007063_20770 [Lentibacillus kapialis]|uniref:Transposase IS701-like DDE domain-containing protein n=2 Tax=Lentibacillus kapialis TaxID=340214 RepID=A0A917PY55_9BACI|nr:hypothetical protein GCM10007063_20770 [Lentibacillus kapialis]
MKQAKEARHMPGVKKLHQESENTSKAAYIFGHLFGAIGVLMGTPRKWFCLPLFINLQDGVKAIFDWSHSSERSESHVIQIIDQGFNAAKGLKEYALLLLDRYFLSVPALKRLTQLNQSRDAQLHIVTRAKMNAVAYELPSGEKEGAGAPAQKRKHDQAEYIVSKPCERISNSHGDDVRQTRNRPISVPGFTMGARP